jgi:hypothetical protein
MKWDYKTTIVQQMQLPSDIYTAMPHTLAFSKSMLTHYFPKDYKTDYFSQDCAYLIKSSLDGNIGLVLRIV